MARKCLGTGGTLTWTNKTAGNYNVVQPTRLHVLYNYEWHTFDTSITSLLFQFKVEADLLRKTGGLTVNLDGPKLACAISYL
jgi:hypothetical protein